MKPTDEAAPRSLTRVALGGLAWTFGDTGSRIVLRLVTVVVLSRLLTPFEFGLFASAGIVLALFNRVGGFGLRGAIVQADELTTDQVRAAFAFTTLSGAVFAGLIVVAAPWAAAFFRTGELTPVLRVLAISFFIEALSGIGEALLQRHLRFKALALTQAMAYLVGPTIVAITMAVLGFGVWSIVVGQLVGSVVKATVVIRTSGVAMGLLPTPTHLRPLLRFGVGLTLNNLANYVALQGDNLVVGRLLGTGPLGIYNRAYTIMAMPANVFGSAVDTVIFPAMASIQRDAQRLARAFRRGLALVAWLTLPASLFLATMAGEIVDVLLGSQWTAAVGPVRILALGLFFRAGYKVPGTLVRATGAVYSAFGRQLVYATTLIVGCIIGASVGIDGVAAGVLVALIVNFVLLTALALKLVDGRLADTALAVVPGLAVTALVGAVVGATKAAASLIELPSVGTLAAAMVLSAIAIVGAVRLAPRWVLGADGQWWLATIRRRLRGGEGSSEQESG